MPELMQEYWVLIVVALVIGVVVAWWIFHASRRTNVQREDRVEDTGGAKRNQALIDAAPAATKDDTANLDRKAAQELVHDRQDAQAAASEASPGAVSAAANSDQIAAAPADADAEAGAAVPAREAIRKAETANVEPAPMTNGPDDGDDLRRLKGVGPKLVSVLHENGVTRFSQIAAWSDEDIDRIDAKLGRFQGRVRRDDWVRQAEYLAKDDVAGYEAQFGKV